MEHGQGAAQELLRLKATLGNAVQPVPLVASLLVSVYPQSIQAREGICFLLGRTGEQKSLWLLGRPEELSKLPAVQGDVVEARGEISLKRCPLTHANAQALRSLFPFTCPGPCGGRDTIGLGDRLGLAGPGQLRGIAGARLMPVLAQQSIRELERTARSPEEVLDAATWTVFQEGYEQGFGADADHLKTTDDLDRMLAAGFKMFTLDPSGFIEDSADNSSSGYLKERLAKLNWQHIGDQPAQAIARYADGNVKVAPNFTLRPTEAQVVRTWVKFGAAVAHTASLALHLLARAGAGNFDLEVSVDESESPTSPFEHYFLAHELRRRMVGFSSLAVHYLGGFEKGVDYRGNLDLFRAEFDLHRAIAEHVGGYKLSFHSGSDKFNLYKVVAEHLGCRIHIKTAGTSYLEALRTVAAHDPDLFYRILDLSRACFESERKTYHVSANLRRVPTVQECRRLELPRLLDYDDARQVLHVGYGKVLTMQDDKGEYVLRKSILACLAANEETHYRYLQAHFARHVAFFK
jgi:hypothetical protein